MIGFRFTRSLARSLTHSLTHSLTRSLARSVTQCAIVRSKGRARDRFVPCARDRFVPCAIARSKERARDRFVTCAIVRSGARATVSSHARASVLSHAHVQSDARARMSSSYPPQMGPETVFRFAPICSLVANAKSRAYYSFSRSQVQDDTVARALLRSDDLAWDKTVGDNSSNRNVQKARYAHSARRSQICMVSTRKFAWVLVR